MFEEMRSSAAFAFALVLLASASPTRASMASASPYAAVDARNDGVSFSNLPGHTRGAYAPDHALITPESRVYTSLFGWKETLAAWFITPAMAGGPQFSMYQALMRPGAESGVPSPGAWRFIFVLDGAVTVVGETSDGASASATLRHGGYAFFPADAPHAVRSSDGASILVYEKPYRPPTGASAAALGPNLPAPAFVFGDVDELPTLETPGETFDLRKLLPQTLEWDVNFHVMDFKPGEFLHVKEMHYNQHGLMLLEGMGIYRLNDAWYSVQAGDVIWMAPFVTQWYAALGKERSRYIILKDTNRDPIEAYV